jgi:hypothetical protein
MFAPKLASVQFLYWFQSTYWEKFLVNFESSNFEYKESVLNKKTEKHQKFMNKSLTSFVSNLANEEEKENIFIGKLKKYPIFMNGSGNPDFNNFVNGKK